MSARWRTEIRVNEVRPVKLSTREKQICDQLLLGKSNKEIAEKLNVAPSTVKTNLERISLKTSCKNRQDLTRFISELWEIYGRDNNKKVFFLESTDLSIQVLGSDAIYTRKTKCICASEVVTSVESFIQCDGRIGDAFLNGQKISPIRNMAGRSWYETTLNKPLRFQDPCEIDFKVCLYDCINVGEDYWLQEQTAPSDLFSFKVIFPEQWVVLSYWAVKRISNIDSESMEIEFDAHRNRLVWEIKDPVVNASYVIFWNAKPIC